jgi:hypothetical protein
MMRLFSERAFLQFVLPVFGGLALAFLFGWRIGAARSPQTPSRPAIGPAAEAPPPPAREHKGAPSGPNRLRLAASASFRSLRGNRVALWLSQATRPLRQSTLRVSEALARRLPLRVKAWWCVRCAVREDQAEGLCRVVRRFACRHMDMPPNAPLAIIAQRIQQQRPGASVAGLQQAFQSLDHAVYAGRNIDLRAWKREFRRRFRRAFAGGRRDGIERPRRGLPELNP